MDGGEWETASSSFGCQRYEIDMNNTELGFEEMFRG